MIKDEDDIIYENLEHHYRLGFRRFFVMDNASTDGTSGLVAAFRAARPDAVVFSCFDPVAGYYQEIKMNALQAFAQSYLAHEDLPVDWIFFVDADEFITCCSADTGRAKSAFQAVLADRDKKMMIFHWVQCASEQLITNLDVNYQPMATFSRRWRKLVPSVPKVAFRGNHDIQTTQGNHTPATYPFAINQSVVMAEAGFYVLHYPMRSVDQLRKKIVNGGRAYEACSKLRSDFGGHWKYYYGLYQQHGDATLSHLLREHIEGCA